MNGNKWREKPAQNKARKSLQLFVKNCSLGGLNASNDQCFRSYIHHSSKLLEFAKDKAIRIHQLRETDKKTHPRSARDWCE